MKIINLTQHVATPEQRKAGIEDLSEEKRKVLGNLLTFEEMPSAQEIYSRARGIVALVEGMNDKVFMIGGAPYLMPVLAAVLVESGREPVYAFSKRESVEEPQPDGSVLKVSIFHYAGVIRHWPVIFTASK